MSPENSALATLFKLTVEDTGFGFAPTAVIEGGIQNAGTAVDQIRVINDGAGHTCLDLHWTVANAHVGIYLLGLGGAGGITYAVSENPSITGMVFSTYTLPQAIGKPMGLLADAVQSSGLVAGAHLAGAGGVPAIAAGTAAGSSPTASISGTDLASTITLTTGTSPTAAGPIATLTFAAAYATAPHPVLTPGNAAAAALSASSSIYAGATASALTLTTGSSALAASTPYVWHYHVAQ